MSHQANKAVRAPAGTELMVGLAGVPLGLLLALTYNDQVLGNTEQRPSDLWVPAGWFVIAYMAVVFLGIRRMTTGNLIALELLWGCNMGMLMFAVGTITGRPVLVGGAMCIVAVDQLCWYIDIGGYLLTGKFKVGVAKYLTW
jgi:hypothetical protein